MSYRYRSPEREGWNRFDDIPDFFGPYGDAVVHDESYSKRPVRSDKSGSESHHQECEYDQINLSTCMCFELFTRDYQDSLDQEAEQMHQEWWQ